MMHALLCAKGKTPLKRQNSTAEMKKKVSQEFPSLVSVLSMILLRSSMLGCRSGMVARLRKAKPTKSRVLLVQLTI